MKMIKCSNNTTEYDAWDCLLENGVSDEALTLITDINGYSMETFDDVARAAFGVGIDDLMGDGDSDF